MSERERKEEDFLPMGDSQIEMQSQAPIQSHKKKRKKKRRKFLHAIFIVLLCISCFIIGGIVISSYAIQRISNSMGISNLGIMDKLTLMEQCVDHYYLYDYDTEDMENGIFNGFMQSLDDPYAAYYSPVDYKQLTESDSGEYKGIGVSVTKNVNNGYTEVMEVFKNDPAYNAGVKVGDFIISVNGKETQDMSLSEVVHEIKGPVEPVKLRILRGTEEIDIPVHKSMISLESVSGEMKEGQIGYISVSQFLENTDEKFIQTVNDLTEQGMKGLIIDLRDNGGGLLDTCVNMVSRIIPEKDLVVYTEDKNGNRNEYHSNSPLTLDIPIVILVNGNTASASEITTGCLKDYSLATVIGTTTFGKGIVQSIIPLTDGSALKLTVSAYYTPSGNNIHKKGIEPDETIELTEEEWEVAKKDPSTDKQLKRAMEILVDAQAN